MNTWLALVLASNHGMPLMKDNSDVDGALEDQCQPQTKQDKSLLYLSLGLASLAVFAVILLFGAMVMERG